VGPSTLGYFSKFHDWFYSNSVPYLAYFVLNGLGILISQETIRRFFMLFFAGNCLLALVWMSFKQRVDSKTLCRAVSWMFLAMYIRFPIPFYGPYLLWALAFLILSEFSLPLLWVTIYNGVGLFFYFKRTSALFLMGLAIYGLALLIRNYRFSRRTDQYKIDA